jgi:hypothetical protein
MDFVVSPPGCGRSVTDFWGWDAHEAQLRCPDEVDGDTWIWSTRRGLNLSSTKLSRPWSPWGSFPSRKNPHGRTGNRNRDLMISSRKLWPLDHEDGHKRDCMLCWITCNDVHRWQNRFRRKSYSKAKQKMFSENLSAEMAKCKCTVPPTQMFERPWKLKDINENTPYERNNLSFVKRMWNSVARELIYLYSNCWTVSIPVEISE